jgi:hypothetical protein
MRRVPGRGRLVVAQAMTVGVAKHGAALRTARPIFASNVFFRLCPSVREEPALVGGPAQMTR